MSHFSGHDLVCVRGERRVFAGLDFSVGDGGALVLVGANGSGKSSLLRLMAGLLPPAIGYLAWDGVAAEDDPEGHRARVHYVGHHDAVKPVLSVSENLEFWSGLRSAKSATSVEEALAAFGIQRLAGIPGRFLSAGQKRRVNLARILAAPAELWLLDEPTTALDKATIAALEDVIARHRADGGMVVVATHSEMNLPGAETLDLGRFGRTLS
jgi:heme exporter protein A